VIEDGQSLKYHKALMIVSEGAHEQMTGLSESAQLFIHVR